MKKFLFRRGKTSSSVSRGYSLLELIVAVGLFALIMTLASGAYLLMIGINRQAQSIATGINSLSFALETMTRSIRTGTKYSCGGIGDCPNGSSRFSFVNNNGTSVTYDLSAGAIQRTIGSVNSNLTGASVTVSSLKFYVFGTQTARQGNYQQPRVTIIVTGTVSSGPGKTEAFTIQTGATMRGTDL